MSSENRASWVQRSSEEVQLLWDGLVAEVCERIGMSLATHYEKRSLTLIGPSSRVLLRGWPRSDSIRFGLWHPDRDSAITRLMTAKVRSRKLDVDRRFRFSIPSDPSPAVRALTVDILAEAVRATREAD